MPELPELSLGALTALNLGLLALYLPFGFMGWAFAAGGVGEARPPSEAKRLVAWITAIALVPALGLLAAALLPHTLSEPWAHRLAWAPALLAALLIALLFLASLVAGFVSGLAQGEEPPP